jgi:putative transposase
VASLPERSKIESFRFISDNGSTLGIRFLCDKLGVSPAGYYKWVNRKESARDIENKSLKESIEAIFHKNLGNYGSPRVHAALKKSGVKVNHKRVERIMKESHLVGKAGRLYRRNPLLGNPCTKVENIKRLESAPEKPNQQWAGDITYLKVNGAWNYLAVIIDLYSRRVVGWEMGKARTAQLTLLALKKAIKSRDVKPGLIFHSDRGAEYGAHVYQNELRRFGIKPSMNRLKHMTDNAHVESFFKSLKTECFHGVSFDDDSELRLTLSWYLNRYYNKERIHTSIGCNNPVEYERMAA